MPELMFALYPCLGGTPLLLEPLAASLRPFGRVHVPTLPGRGTRTREAPYASFPALVDHLDELLLREQRSSSRPPVLFGFSMGGLLATELAYRCQERGSPPAGLIVASCPPPHHTRSGTPLSDLADDEFVERLRRQSVLSPQVADNPELVSILMPTWRADARVVESRRVRTGPLACRVLAVAAEDDPVAPLEVMLEWRDVGAAGSEVVVVSGGHAAPMTPEVLRPLFARFVVETSLERCV